MAATSAASADVLWGANGHPLTSYPGIPIERQFDYLEDLGLKSYRVNIVNLSMVDQLEKLVSEGKKRGIEILPVITPGDIDLEKDDAATLYNKARDLAVGLGHGSKMTSGFGNSATRWRTMRLSTPASSATTVPNTHAIGDCRRRRVYSTTTVRVGQKSAQC